jgi:hypothetical protein
LSEMARYESSELSDKLLGADLLNEVTAQISRYVVLKKHEARAIALDRAHARLRLVCDLATPQDPVTRTGLRQNYAARCPAVFGSQSLADCTCECGCNLPRYR